MAPSGECGAPIDDRCEPRAHSPLLRLAVVGILGFAVYLLLMLFGHSFAEAQGTKPQPPPHNPLASVTSGLTHTVTHTTKQLSETTHQLTLQVHETAQPAVQTLQHTVQHTSKTVQRTLAPVTRAVRHTVRSAQHLVTRTVATTKVPLRLATHRTPPTAISAPVRHQHTKREMHRAMHRRGQPAMQRRGHHATRMPTRVPAPSTVVATPRAANSTHAAAHTSSFTGALRLPAAPGAPGLPAPSGPIAGAGAPASGSSGSNGSGGAVALLPHTPAHVAQLRSGRVPTHSSWALLARSGRVPTSPD